MMEVMGQEPFQIPIGHTLAIKLSKDDIEIFEKEAPRLKYDTSVNLISGELGFNLCYDEKGVRITDSYSIQIDLNSVADGIMPVVKETGGRIKKTAERMGKPLADLHISQDGSLCLGIPPKIKERYSSGFNLLRLIHHIQEHLYWVSYVEKYGNEPWKAYAHGDEGYLELFEEGQKYHDDVYRYLEDHYHCKTRSEKRRKLEEWRKDRKHGKGK